MQVIWNEVCTEKFWLTRGIRQGDPLFPYLFVLAMEKLSHVINDAVQDGRWEPISLGRKGPGVSHLMFSDELLVFGVATDTQIDCTLKCLDEFCKFSGQKGNKLKSTIMFSENVGLDVKRTIVSRARFTLTKRLGNYLGIPLSNHRLRKQDFGFILEKNQ